MRVALAVALLVGASSCSIAPQEGPHAIDPPSEVPSAGADPSGPATSADQVELRATVYLVTDADDLVAVVRPIAVDGGADDELAAVLASLIDGPSDEDVEAGMRSAVPPTTSIRSVVLDGSVATIDLSADFAAIGGPEELLAVGQFGLTATTFPGIRAMRLRLEGEPIDIPLPDGALTDDPVTLGQFSALLGPGDEREDPG